MRLYQTDQWFRDRRMPVRIVICKARRAGLSTGCEAMIYDDTSMNPNTFSLIVANEKNPSENVLGMCTRFWRNTPEFLDFDPRLAQAAGIPPRIALRPAIPSSFNNNPPKDRFVFDEPHGGRIFVATARSIDGYLGYGFQNMHATEAGYYVDGHELFRALYPTLSTDSHSALYIESTPNGQQGRGQWFHEQCMDANARKDTQFGEMKLVFIPWHEMVRSFAIPFADEEKRIAFGKQINTSEKDLVRRFPHISLEQLAWRRMVLAGPTFNRDEDLFDQEFPTDLASAFLQTGTSLFGRKDIKRYIARARPPVWTGDIYWGDSDEKNEREPAHETVRRPRLLTKGQARASGFESHTIDKTFNNLSIFRHPVMGERIFVACDVGLGNPATRDGDFSVVVVGVLNELEQDEVIMTWRGRLNPILFGELVSALCWAIVREVGDGAIMPELVPEWTGPGVGMCTYIDQKNLYPKLYRYQQPGVHKLPSSKHVGWESNAKTKPLAIAHTLRMVERDLIDIPDMELILEMAGYRQLDSFGDVGSYGGSAGRHDDLVSAFTILCAVLRLRSATIPGDQVTEYVDEDQIDWESDLPPFSPFETDLNDYGMPGIKGADLDEDSYGELAAWS